MKLEFILADTTWQSMKAGLSEFAMQAKVNVFDEYLVLVPETKTLEAEQLLMETSGAFVNVSINSFDRLLEKIDVKITRKPLTREASIMLIRKIVYELKDDLVCFKKSASSVGFIESIFDTISQIKSSGLSPQEFSLSAKDAKQSLRLKLKDISLIYDAYQTELENTYSDASDRLDILAMQAKDSEWIKKSHVLICGYDTLTQKAMNMIKSIVKNAKDVTVACSFMHPDSKNYHIAETEVFDAFKKLAGELHIPYNPKRIITEYKSDFQHIKNNLYSYPVEAIKSDGFVSMYSFNNQYIELDNICKLIKDRINNGCRYKDIAIVYSDLETNKRLIEEKMQEYEIPYFISKPYDYATHPFFTCIKSYLDMCKKGLEQSSVLSFVKNFFVDAEGKEEFENYCLKYGINRNKFLKPFTINQEKNKEDIALAESCRTTIVNIYLDLQKYLLSAKTYKDYVNLASLLLEKLQVTNQIEKLSDVQRQLGDTQGEAISEQVLEKCNSVLESIVTFLGETATTLEEFALLLQSGLASSDISLIPQTIDCLRIQQNGEGLSAIKHLYICNAVEGNFPIKSEDCGMISDAEIGYLAENTNRKIEPTIRTLNRRERFRAYELLLLPESSLTLSSSNFNTKGEEEKASAIFSMISKMFFDGEEYLKINTVVQDFSLANFDNEGFLKYNPTLKNAERNFLQSAHVKNNAASMLTKDRVNDLYFALVKNGFNFTEIKENAYRQDLYIDNAEDLFFKNGRVSVSELESYFSCPFLHFANYGLKIKEEKQADLKAVDVGDILHKVVENYLRLMIKNKHVKPKELLTNILIENKYLLDENKILIKILEAEVERICQALKNEVESSNFVPTYFEMWYGEKGKVKSIDAGNGVRIEGKIDRVDTYGDKLRVIDYKTGKIDDKPADIYYGKKIQLITYLCALEEMGKQPVASLYFPIRNEFAGSEEKSESAYKMKGIISSDAQDVLSMDKTLNYDNPKSHIIDASISASKKNREEGKIVVNSKSNIIEPELFKNIQNYVRKLINGAIKEIKKGYIAAAPLSIGDMTPCDYCKYINICGIQSKNAGNTRKCNSKVTLKNIAEVDYE